MVRIRINQDLPRAWRPTPKRLKNIESHLVRSGECVVWDTHLVRETGCKAGGASGGVEKRKKCRRRSAPRGPRTPRITLKGRLFTVRQLLFVFATGNVAEREVRPGCNNGRCIDPRHQTSKGIQEEHLRLRRIALGPWNLTNSDE